MSTPRPLTIRTYCWEGTSCKQNTRLAGLPNDTSVCKALVANVPLAVLSFMADDLCFVFAEYRFFLYIREQGNKGGERERVCERTNTILVHQHHEHL